MRQIKVSKEVGEAFHKLMSPDVEYKECKSLKNLRSSINTSINTNQCSWCDKPDFNFRDALSKKEYEISAMCQTCQDEVFTHHDILIQNAQDASHFFPTKSIEEEEHV